MATVFLSSISILTRPLILTRVQNLVTNVFLFVFFLHALDLSHEI